MLPLCLLLLPGPCKTFVISVDVLSRLSTGALVFICHTRSTSVFRYIISCWGLRILIRPEVLKFSIDDTNRTMKTQPTSTLELKCKCRTVFLPSFIVVRCFIVNSSIVLGFELSIEHYVNAWSETVCVADVVIYCFVIQYSRSCTNTQVANYEWHLLLPVYKHTGSKL